MNEATDIAYAETVRAPAAWSPPVGQRFGLVVEVGRQGDDVLYHLWHDKFPDTFADRLYDAVEQVMGCPERFQAAYTPEIMAIWDPRSGELHPGDADRIRRIAITAPARQLTSWAVRATGFAPVREAHSRLTDELLAAIENIFIDG